MLRDPSKNFLAPLEYKAWALWESPFSPVSLIEVLCRDEERGLGHMWTPGLFWQASSVSMLHGQPSVFCWSSMLSSETGDLMVPPFWSRHNPKEHDHPVLLTWLLIPYWLLSFQPLTGFWPGFQATGRVYSSPLSSRLQRIRWRQEV